MAGEMDWTLPTNQETTQGIDRPTRQANLNLRKRANELSHSDFQPFQAEPATIAAIDRAIEELSKKFKVPKGASLPLSVTGKSKEIQFTPGELYKAATDYEYASQIYSKTTGMPEVNRSDVLEFQKRIRKEYPLVIHERQHIRDQSPYDTSDIDHIINPVRDQRNRRLERPAQPPHVIAQPAVLPEYRQRPVREISHFLPPNTTPEQFRANAGFRDLEGNFVNYTQGHVPTFQIPAGLSEHPIALAMARVAPEERENRMATQRRAGLEELHGRQQTQYNNYLAAQREYNEVQHIRANLPLIEHAERKQAESELARGLAQRAGLEYESGELRKPLETTAPMNEYHKAVERLMNRSIGEQDPSNQLFLEEIRKLGQRRELPDIVEPYLKEASRHPKEFIEHYHNAHEKAVIDQMRNEASTKFIDELLPSINARFPMGSGVREAILQSHAAKMERDLNKNIGELRHRNFENAMKMSEGHRGISQQSAQIAGNAERMQQQEVLNRMNAMREQNLAQKGMAQSDIQAQSQVATQKQQQRQNEINQARAEQARAEQHRWDQLSREAAIAHGLPAPTTVTSTLSSTPPPNPPNSIVYGSALAGDLLSMGRRPGAKQGGHMKFAEGGIATHEGAIQNYADKVANPYFDPVGNWMSHMVPALYKVSGAPEMAEASSRAHASREAHQDRKAQGWKTAADLHNTLLQSKFDQKRILQEYQRHRENLAETSRHNRATEQEHVAKLIEKNAPKEVQIGEHTIKPKNKMGMTPADIRHMEKVDKEIKDLEKLKFGYKRYLEHLDELDAKNYHPPTGEIYEALPQSWKNDLGIRDYMLRQNVVGNEAQEGARAFVAALAQSGRQKISPGMSYPMRREDIVQKLEELDPHLEEKIYSKEFAAGDIPGRKTEGIYRKWVKAGKPGPFELYAKAYLEGTPLPNKTNGRTHNESDHEDTSALEAEYKALKQRNSKAGIG